MSLHVVSDPFQPIARGRAIWLIVGFALVLAAGPALFLGGVRTRTRSTPPPPVWSDDAFVHGEFTAELDRWIVESSPVTAAVRKTFDEIWMRLGLLETRGAVLGRGGLVFLQATTGNDERFVAARDTRRAALAALARRAERLGVRVLVAIVPDKASIYPDRLPTRWGRSAGRAALYSIAFAEVRSAGFEAVDLLEAMRAWRRARPEELLFRHLDTHWTLDACLRTGELLRIRLDALGWLDALPRAPMRAQPALGATISGDLVQQLGLAEGGAFGSLLSGEIRWVQMLLTRADGIEAASRAVEPEADIALAGDSFPATGLVPALMGHLGRLLDSGGVKPSRGPREGLEETLDRIERGELRAKVVVWAVIERSFNDVWWDH